jgi:hypothetical protein
VHADVGAVLATSTIPADGAAQCADGAGFDSGTALALVPGGKVGLPKRPVLLVISCVSAGSVRLVFLDPSTDPASHAKTITTVFPSTGATPARWDALVLRPDRGDLLGCGTPAGAAASLWTIDVSPFNAVADGTATVLRSVPASATCAGIAWDASDGSLYLTPAAGADVVRVSATGAVSTVPSGCATAVTAVSVAGTSLFVGCAGTEGSATVNQRDKASGAAVRSFAVAALDPVGLPDDPITFAPAYQEALWTKDGAGDQLVALEIPGGTLGQKTGAPVATPGACPAGNADSDGDGLLDCWETAALWTDNRPGINYAGVYDGDPATRDVELCADTNGDGAIDTLGASGPTECADPTRKDLFVEIDHVQLHRPNPTAVANVVQMFAAAPTPPGPVRLHVQVGEQVGPTHLNTISMAGCTTVAGNGDYDVLKRQFFGTAAERARASGQNAKALAFRYGMFVHNLAGLGTTSGCAEILGDDFVVAMGSWGSVNGHNVGTTDQQSGTLAHELGHTLGLRHGGGDSVNCKPNYPSVMNYPRQFSNTVSPRPLDYSRVELGVPLVLPDGTAAIGLDEAHLDEAKGVGVGLFTGQKIAHGPVPQLGRPTVVTVPSTGLVNWDRDGTADADVSIDINQMTSASGDCRASPGQVLVGFNDWANVRFNQRASVDFAAGASGGGGESTEIDLEQALELSRDAIDIKTAGPRNQIKRQAQTILVTILSRNDDDGVLEFDATTVDPSTVVLRGVPPATWTVSVKQTRGKFNCSSRDTNGDGLRDLVCSFRIPKGTVAGDEMAAVLEAETTAGQSVFGSDVIRVK